MISLYSNNVADYDFFISNCNVLHQIPIKTYTANDFTKTPHGVSDVFAHIFSFFSSVFKNFENYYEKYELRFMYETAFEIYHTTNFSYHSEKLGKIDNHTKKSVTRDELLMKYYSVDEFSKGYGEKFSRDKGLLISETSEAVHTDKAMTMPLKTNLDSWQSPTVKLKNRKYNTVYKSIYLPLYLYDQYYAAVFQPIDIIFSIDNYNQTFFSNKNVNKGILIKNYYDMSSVLSNIHANDAPFTQEYSSYLYEYLYSAIQYQRCFCSYLKQPFNQEVILQEYGPVSFYTKLFDTHHLSLSDFILNTYEPPSKLYYNCNGHLGTNFDDDKEGFFFHTFYQKQLFDDFLFPIIKYLIKDTLLHMYKNDIMGILEDMKSYIKDLNNSLRNTTFYNILKNSIKEMDACRYPNTSFTLFERCDAGSTNYEFNHRLSKTFFLDELSLSSESVLYDLGHIDKLLNDSFDAIVFTDNLEAMRKALL